MATWIVLFETPDLTLFCFHPCSWMKNKIYKGEMDTTDELLAPILVLPPA
jgi:hypothetical protein